MLNSRIVQTRIDRPYHEAYTILSEPRNFPLWSPNLESRFEPRGNDGLDWLVDLPTGTNILRFTRRNPYGVLDYTILTEDGEHLRTNPMRLVRNGEGCELVTQFFQQAWQDDAAFNSYVDWAANDLLALKSVVETL